MIENDMVSMAMNTRTEMAQRDQRGAVLFVSLMFLIVMTLIGVTAMSTANLQETMAGNARDKNLSFEAAEAALRDAESNILGIAALAAFNNTDGLYVLRDDTGEQRFEDNDWDAADWQNDANTVSYADYPDTNPLPSLASAPRFYIEELPPVKDTDSLVVGTGVPEFKIYHRITARGVGQSATGITILQSTYLRD
jgi:type IV pilus assembly protein PilX